MVVMEREAGVGRAVEHRVELLPILEHPEAHLAELVERLTEFGADGWRVVSIDLSHHPSYSPAAQPTTQLPVLLARPQGARRKVEYRIERMPFQEHPEQHLSELVERLTELCAQGWCVASVDLTHHPSYSPAAQPNVPLPVLLARET